jgi:ABC-type phosphate/phosphonate transport system substrate-binding protein
MSQILFIRRTCAFLPQRLSPFGRVARVSLCLLLWFVLFWQASGPVAAQAAEVTPKVLRAGFLASEFSEIDPRDAKAALEMQARRVSRSLGYGFPLVTIFPSLQSMSEAVRRGELELVTMPSIEYLKLRKTTPLIPAFVASNNGGQGTRYVIIARKDSGIRSFADLRGRSLLLASLASHEQDPGQLWLEVLLLKAGKGARGSYFSQVKVAPRMFNGIMAVFLRQADAAVVTRAGLDASRQLNPQLAQLTVVAESRPLSDGVTCLNPRTPENIRNRLYQELLGLNETSEGRQMYTIFHVSGMTPFTAACLEGLEELVNDYDRLKGLSGRRK